MRRAALALGSAIALVALTAGSAAADTNGGDNGKDSGDTLTLYATESTSVALSPEGEELGDDEVPTAGARIVVVDTLYSDEDREDEVGRNDVACTFTEVADDEKSANLLCEGVVTLDDEGTLAWSGAASFDFAEEPSEDEPFIVVAITGGTEDFVDAGGQVEIFDDGSTDEENLSRYEVDLSH